MKMEKVFCILILLFFVSPIVGQQTLEEICKNVDDVILQPTKPIKIYRKDYFSNSCTFEFDVTETQSIYIDVERHKSEKESRQSLENSHYLFTFQDDLNKRKRKKKKIETNGFWDQVIMYDFPKGDVGFMLLRKKKYEITVFAQSVEVLTDIEKLLRRFNFADE